LTKAKIMNRLISICFLLFFVVTGNAQVNNKPKLNELTQDQLNLSLTKSKKTIKTGIILTIVGLGVTITGAAIIVNEANKAPTGPVFDENIDLTGYYVTIIGGAIILAGIPVWIVGASKKNKIELELVKFNPKGSASINGIGLKVRF
jgi:hypothetical protein